MVSGSEGIGFLGPLLLRFPRLRGFRLLPVQPRFHLVHKKFAVTALAVQLLNPFLRDERLESCFVTNSAGVLADAEPDFPPLSVHLCQGLGVLRRDLLKDFLEQNLEDSFRRMIDAACLFHSDLHNSAAAGL